MFCLMMTRSDSRNDDLRGFRAEQSDRRYSVSAPREGPVLPTGCGEPPYQLRAELLGFDDVVDDQFSRQAEYVNVSLISVAQLLRLTLFFFRLGDCRELVVIDGIHRRFSAHNCDLG